MTDFFSAYKPFRNHIAKFSLIPSLVRLWGYGLHVVEKKPLLSDLGVGRPPFVDLRTQLHPWDIELLVRELLLHAGTSTGPDLANWSALAKVVNKIRELEDHPFTEDHEHLDVLLHLNRVAYRQFRWQGMAMSLPPVVGALKVFGGDELDALTYQRYGMSMLQVVRLSFAVCGHFLSRWDFNTETDFSVLGISKNASRAYFDHLSTDVPTLRRELAHHQLYDHSWAYTWNPLEATPLIRVDQAHPNRVICPIPRFALFRGTTGVFFDVGKAPGFDNKYGAAFQDYVGEILQRACPAQPFQVQKFEPFESKKGKLMHGPDWILSDGSAHLVVECKTKRMSLGAKQLNSLDALEKDVTALAEAVVQNYKNIRSAQHGDIAWRPVYPHIFPIVVTLEEWYLLSPQIGSMLEGHIVRLLNEHKIDLSVLETMPFCIVSANELEYGAQVIAQTGIAAVVRKASSSDRRYRAMRSVLDESYPEQLKKVRPVLFEAEARAIDVPPLSVAERFRVRCYFNCFA